MNVTEPMHCIVCLEQHLLYSSWKQFPRILQITSNRCNRDEGGGNYGYEDEQVFIGIINNMVHIIIQNYFIH